MIRGAVGECAAWMAAVGIGACVIAAVSYGARDADSKLYAEIGARMAQQEVGRWIAPEGPPGSYIKGLFREHPVGIHVLPAILVRLGYPARPAAYAANAFYQAVCLIVLWRLVARLVDGMEARALCVLLQLLPIAFTYRIRANHEQAVLLCLLLSLYGAERSRREPRFALVMAAGLVGLLLIKGVFVVPGILACGMWIVIRRGDEGRAGVARGLVDLALASAAILAAAAVYEGLYREATGESFWAVNLGRQIGVAAVVRSDEIVLEKIRNAGWYLARLLWFAFPWSLVVLAAVSRRTRPGQAARACAGSGREGLWFAVGLAAALVVGFSLSDRVADRYIFPAYYAAGAAGAVLALRGFPKARLLFARLDRWHPWPAIAVWAVTFGLHLLGGRLGVPTVKVWTP